MSGMMERERPDVAESASPVVAGQAAAPGCDPSGAPVVEDAFVTFTEWGGAADEAADADL